MNTIWIVLILAVLAGIVVCTLIGIWVVFRRIISRRGTNKDTSYTKSVGNDGQDEAEPTPRADPLPAVGAKRFRMPSENAPAQARPSFRFIIVGGIIAVLLIPLFLVQNLARERAILYQSVVTGISRTSGGLQWLSGPYLLIPFSKKHQTRDALIVDYFVVLPEELTFSGHMRPEERRRGIYRSLVYTADVTMQGRFLLPAPESLERTAPDLIAVDYAKAFVVMGLAYPEAVREAGPFVWNESPLKAEPGTQPFSKLDKGFRIPVGLSGSTETYAFSQHFLFSGSGGIRFTPAGERTSIALDSPWPHPSFQGDILPHKREVSAAGFTAFWSIPSLARPFPRISTVSAWPSKSKQNCSVGLDFFESGSHYQLVQRSTKYGILFISLTFLAFIVFEMSMRARLHPVQYGLVGLAMVVFYLVLLSLAEHVSFALSYAVAATCTICMIAAYTAAAFRSVRHGGGVGVWLVALYALLYAILQLEDYALLMGTALVVIMLAALMVVSRNLENDRNIRPQADSE